MAASPRPQSSPENKRRVQFRSIHMFKDIKCAVHCVPLARLSLRAKKEGRLS